VTSANELVIFQLGDVHMPEFNALKTEVDSHDKREPGNIGASLELPLPHAIKEALVEALMSEPAAVVAICGDLTSRGDRVEYANAASYLAKILHDPRLDSPTPTHRIHVVPGNHDIAFKADQKFVSFDDVSRFGPLRATCIEQGLGDVLALDFRETNHAAGAGNVKIMSVNTARGAGASRVANAVVSDPLLNAALEGMTPERVGEIIDIQADDSHEVLDIPFLHPEDIKKIAVAVGRADPRVLPVVIGHHGLLPQHTPRLNPYTEMANAGQARRELSKLDRPVIYLHGHIHQDVIETVMFPKPSLAPGGIPPLVVISAPLLSDGFNKIIVRFDGSGTALGVKITKFRINHGDQTVSAGSEVTSIPLGGRQLAKEVERELLQVIIQKRVMSGNEILEVAAASPSIAMGPDEVETFVEQLYWQGILNHANGLDQEFKQTGFIF